MPQKSKTKSKDHKPSSSKKSSRNAQNLVPLSSPASAARDPFAFPSPRAPYTVQQDLLDIFHRSFPQRDINELRETIQKVKSSLYARDFNAAFATTENQEAYCLRWGPSRALAYLDLLLDIPLVKEFLSLSRGRTVLSIGGGAGAEVVAFSVALKCIGKSARDGQTDVGGDSESKGEGREECSSEMILNAVDIADWSHVLRLLSGSLFTRTTDVKREEDAESVEGNEDGASPNGWLKTDSIGEKSPKEQQQDEEAANMNLPQQDIPASRPHLSLNFVHHDVLDMRKEDVQSLLKPHPVSNLDSQAITDSFADLTISSSSETSHTPDSTLSTLSHSSQTPLLITIFFTLNELYTSSLPKTTSFLLHLTDLTPPGTLLLVVDSPGSYSTVALKGNAERKYPMSWMLDHTLLESTREGKGEEQRVGGDEKGGGAGGDGEARGDAKWTKVGSEESRWWRMNRTVLRYKVPGVELEDMRMQWHLYRRA